MSLPCASMHVMVLVCSLSLAAVGQLEHDDWIDPYDMLNYDASTKTMRKPAEPSNYPNVPTKRREYIQDSNEVELTVCNQKVEVLQREVEDQKKRIAFVLEQPTCNPVFKRFLTRLLKEIERVGVPSDHKDIFYDAKVRLSRQAGAEIRKLLEGEESWKTGALDDAVSQILVDLKPHDYEAWKWHFEDSFGVEIDTVLKVSLCVMVIVAIICTQLWSVVSWCVRFKRMFAICFFISIVWNWFYLYKIAFAEHQNNIVKMDSVNDKCTGMRKIDWSDSLKEWFRSTWTLQDDPCKRYYEVLMVNPILLVPPTKAISVTITTFITEPLKHFGQGISEFLRALLKDLPVTLQIPVLITIVLSVLVFLYGGVQAAFQHGITAPLRRGRRDPPPPAVNQPQPPQLRDVEHDRLEGGDAPQRTPRPLTNQSRLDRAHVRQRRPNRAREEPTRVLVETLHRADRPFSEDETDTAQTEGAPDAEQPDSGSSVADSQTEGDSDDREETWEEVAGASTGNITGDLRAKQPNAKAKSSPAKDKPVESNSNASQVKATKSSVGNAKPSQAKHGDVTHLESHCAKTSKTVCKPCREGTYTAYYNYIPNCLRCTSCRGPREIELTPCEKHKNRVCVCKDGYYRDGTVNMCVKHSSCPAGQGVETRGTSFLDTKCKYCSKGTYSSESSATQECLTHTLCSNDSFVALEGTAVHDTVCGNCSKSVDDHISPLVLVILKDCKRRFQHLKKNVRAFYQMELCLRKGHRVQSGLRLRDGSLCKTMNLLHW